MRLNYVGVSLYALFFGILAIIIAIFIAFVIARNSRILMLILGGIISSSIFSGGVGLIKYLADSKEVLPNIVFWLLSSLSHVDKMGFCLRLLYLSLELLSHLFYQSDWTS